MGMFDYVWTRCPNCDTKVEFQSKAGECVMADLNLFTAPAVVQIDLIAAKNCSECGRMVTIERFPPSEAMPLVIVK